MLELIPDIPDHIVALHKSGEENPDDYENIFVPAVEQAQQKHDKIQIVQDC